MTPTETGFGSCSRVAGHQGRCVAVFAHGGMLDSRQIVGLGPITDTTSPDPVVAGDTRLLLAELTRRRDLNDPSSPRYDAWQGAIGVVEQHLGGSSQLCVDGSSVEGRLRGVDATLAMVDDIHWEGVEPRAFVVSDGDRRISYDRDNFARLLLGMPMREPALAVGDRVKADDLNRVPAGTLLSGDDGTRGLVVETSDPAVERDVEWADLRGDLNRWPATVLDLPTGGATAP